MIYILLANGFEEIEALTPADIFKRAGLAVSLVGIDGEYVTGVHGITVKTDIFKNEQILKTLSNNKTELILFPGGMPGASNLDASQVTDIFLAEADQSQAYIAAICAAPMILGKRGYLRGKKATCYPGFEKYLDGAEIIDAGAVADGRFITGRAMGAALEFSLLMTSKLKGDAAANDIRRAVITK